MADHIFLSRRFINRALKIMFKPLIILFLPEIAPPYYESVHVKQHFLVLDERADHRRSFVALPIGTNDTQVGERDQRFRRNQRWYSRYSKKNGDKLDCRKSTESN